MSDIAMCQGVTASLEGMLVVCQRKEQCYRHTAPANPYRQAWMVTPLVVAEQGTQECEYFWMNEGR